MSKRFLIACVAVALTGLLMVLIRGNDKYFWPVSAHGRIEKMASILRSIEGPARWCYPSVNAHKLINQNGYSDERLSRCMSRIAPVSDFEEIHEKEYVRRIYRVAIEESFCELTLSTVWNDDRVVGSDYYYGLFERSDDTGIGLTADPFG